MSARTSDARRRAFFAALAETGNQTVAAERARVSRFRVQLHRAGDPAFRAELEAAAAAKVRLDRAAGVGPAPRWRGQGGEGLVVRVARAAPDARRRGGSLRAFAGWAIRTAAIGWSLS